MDIAPATRSVLEGPRRYQEVVRAASMSVGVYAVPRGGVDSQRPHGEDEVYYVLRGRGRFRQGQTDTSVAAGELLFVPAQEEHHFHDVEEDLLLLVCFAPPEGTNGPVDRRAPP